MIRAGSRLSEKGHLSAVKNECCAFLRGLMAGKECVQVFNEINFKNIYLFSDSHIILSGVSSNSLKQKQFYASRNFQSAQIISELKIQLYFVPGKELDADKVSKSNLKINFALDRSYFHSNWLERDIKDWPIHPFIFQLDSQILNNPKLISCSAQVNTFFDEMIGKFPDYNVLIKKLKFLFTWFSSNHFEAYVKAKNYILQRGQVDKKTITGLARKFIVKQDSKGLWFVYPRQLFWQGQRIQPRLHVKNIRKLYKRRRFKSNKDVLFSTRNNITFSCIL